MAESDLESIENEIESLAVPVLRTMLVLGGVIYPAWSVFLLVALPEAFDNLPQRFMVGLCFFATLFASYQSQMVRQNLTRFFFVNVLILTGHYYYLAYQAQLSTIYTMGSLVVSCALSGLFFSRSLYLLYSVFTAAACALVIYLVKPHMHTVLMLSAGIASIHVVFFFVLNARLKTMEMLRREKIHSAELETKVLELRLKEAQSQAEKYRLKAHFDDLTKIPNRLLFEEMLGHTFELAKRRSTPDLALIFVDLDGFKEVNDNLGHDAGDVVLEEVANRLNRAVRKSDFAARLGGDEFVVMLPKTKSIAGATLVAGRILEEFSHPFFVNGEAVSIGASIGIAAMDKATASPEQLVKKADIAMYNAKNCGKNQIVIYDESSELTQVSTS